MLQNANQFHKWHAELEAARASETEEKYQRYAALLNGHLASCDGIQLKVACVCVGGGGHPWRAPRCMPMCQCASPLSHLPPCTPPPRTFPPSTFDYEPL